jgi:hypothetical protein
MENMSQILPFERQIESNRLELTKAEKDPHLELINVKELTEKDLIMYAMVKDNVVSEKELLDYRREISAWVRENKKDSLNDSRKIFAEYLLNKLIAKNAGKKIKEKREQIY